MPHSRRIQSRIDPTEEQLQFVRNHVRHGLAGGGEQFLFRWFAVRYCAPPQAELDGERGEALSPVPN